MINLHLGCGKLRLDDFINVDIQSEYADMKLDINNLEVFSNGTVDQIYICHVLEHISRQKILNLFLEWNRVLKIGGILRISVPDFEKVIKVYLKNKNMSDIIGFLNGGQRDKFDFHFVNFDINIITELLTVCGFKNIRKYSPFDFLGEKDDYSKSYLPHMDFENGEAMSLNIMCEKESDINNSDVNLTPNLKKFLKN